MVSRLHRLPTICFILLLLLVCTTASVAAQTTAFTYQGKLTDSGNPANGSYDLQFKLFDTATVGTGTQQGSTVTVSNVVVTSGIFTVTLDFGACASCFNGTARFLEIAVRPTGGSFTTLTPRQPITSTPYAIKSANSTTADGLSVACVNCVTSSQIQSVNGSAVTGTIPVASVPAGSGNYIQNGTSQQTSSNFNISGTGTANILNATTQFNLNGSRLLSIAGTNNLFAGINAGTNNTGQLNAFFGTGAGQANTTGLANAFFGAQVGNANTSGGSNAFFGAGAGLLNTTGSNNAFFGRDAGSSNTASDNAFFGTSAGASNTIGTFNAFFGSLAGQANTTASYNAFFGYQAGKANTTGGSNAFFGYDAGYTNTTGNANSFFGVTAGLSNTTGGSNSFFGWSAGYENTSGVNNAFFGLSAGQFNTTGSNNTFIGYQADFNVPTPTGDNNTLLGYNANVNSGVSNGTAIGALASVTQSNSLILGSINGVNSATADTNVGIGTTAPAARLNVNGTSWFQGDSTPLAAAAGKGLAVGFSPPNGNGYIFAFDYATFQPQTLALNSPGGRVGIGTLSPDQTLTVNGGASKPGGGSWATFSDARLKNITGRFTPGLRAVLQLQPIRYEYKRDNALGIDAEGEHIGFSAQAVQKIIPEAVSRNDRGYLLVNNDPILWTMLNAVKEQQAQIEKQTREITRLKQREQRQSKPQPSTIQLRQQIKQQRDEISRLKQLVCLDHPKAALCRKAH